MLTAPEINKIEAKANSVLESVFGSIIDITMPVPLNIVLDKYDITVAIGDFTNKEVSGAYDKASKMIYIADDEPANRKAFTVGHELGHFFLHEQKSEDIFYRAQIINLPDEERKDEQEANWFAATLLMPESQLKRFYSMTKDLAELATVFGVSSTAVYYRLKNLGLQE